METKHTGFLILIWELTGSDSAFIRRSASVDESGLFDMIQTVHKFRGDENCCDVYLFDESDNTFQLTQYGWLTLAFSTRGPSRTERIPMNENYINAKFGGVKAITINNNEVRIKE